METESALSSAVRASGRGPSSIKGASAVMSMAIHSASGPIWEHIRQPAWVRVINAAGAVLRRVGVRWPRLDAETLLTAS
jgi:hypothetical protein